MASMRPRVFPAEDALSWSRWIQSACASMRPRVFPAEDASQHATRADNPISASMRPRVFPAEDSGLADLLPESASGFNEAAGIPRGRPTMPVVLQTVTNRFNEAAGIPRGRRDRLAPARPAPYLASMRPRVFPAEDSCAGRSTRYPLHRCSFNEAAGIPRGRPKGRWPPNVLLDASMRPRVFPAEDASQSERSDCEIVSASMRPRVFPAEDVDVDSRVVGVAAASMRPRVFPAEDPQSLPSRAQEPPRFNEAAGIPRGRPGHGFLS